ncbi:MAG: DUF2157 domain-containing protein [Spirochaetes bacterium]|nr:DUF2157 domain-containing protein [Spirochaetota bacterium]
MAKNSFFIRELISEVRKWTEQRIITREQQNQIESLYAVEAESHEKNKSSKKSLNLNSVIMGLAVLCLTAGIIIFYASNWKKMPPSIKLIQVFFLVIASYCSSAWFLFSENRSRLIGRSLLVLGMVSYGAAIMLVAQIYHISAHPTNGILAWAAGVFLIAALMRERFGLYIASLLFFIWNCWEFAVYDNPAYLYLLFIALTAFLYIRLKDVPGIIASLCFLLIYYYQSVIPDFSYKSDFEVMIFQAGLLNLPLGAMLLCAGSYFRDKVLFRPVSYLMSVFGWLIFILPFLAMSWPFGKIEAGIFASFGVSIKYSSIYTAFIAISAILIYLIRKSGKPVKFLTAACAFPALVFFLPMGDLQVRMISFHGVIAALFFFFLYYSHTAERKDIFNTILAYIFAFSAIIVKGFGFVIYAFISEKYKVAYLAGFIIFAVVCLLLNVLVENLAKKRGVKYSPAVIHALCAAMMWISVYAASFEIIGQRSIFSANRIVVILIILFSVIAAGLFVWLVKTLKNNRIIVYLAGLVSVFTLTALFIAGPDTSWIVYSMLFNSLLVIFSSIYMFYSSVIQSKALLNIMVCAFVLHILTRYFDLFWDMLSGSIFLLCTGLIGITAGIILENRRRSLSRKIKAAEMIKGETI